MTKDRYAAVRLLLAALFLISPFLAARQAAAQFGARSEVVNIFLPAPRELRRMLSAAEEAIAASQYAEAVDALGSILVDTESEDYFLGTGEGAQASLKAEAQRLLGTMPEAGRQQYEIKYGPAANRLLEQAVAEGNMQTLSDITRMYFHTKAGYNATLLLGQYEMNQGRPLAAALHFQRLKRLPSSRQFEPQLSLLLANCWLMSGQPESAEQALREMKKSAAGGKVTIGGRDVPLFDDDARALAWLETTCGATLDQQRGGQSDWLVYRGNPSRNAVAQGAMPLLSKRDYWDVPIANDPKDEVMARDLAKGFRDAGVPALPAFQPLAVGDWVLMRTPSQLLGVNFESGKRVWEYPWEPSRALTDDRPASNGRGNAVGPRDEELRQRLWEDAAFGQVASDGESVFLLDKLKPAFNSRNQRVLVMAGGRLVQQGVATSNELVALNLQSQGKLRWIAGGETGGEEPKLADVFFLGAPLPLGGALYILGEINGEIRLFALDAKTGQLEWAQQLALLEGQSVLMDRTRRLAGATPSFADGVLVCPTSAGALVAVDLSTRSLLWGYQYKRQPLPTRFRSIPSQQREIGSHWDDASVTIESGRVLVTPVEGDSLLCLDLFTGRSIWEVPREDNLYVACADHDKVVLVGKSKVRARKMADGEELSEWGTSLDTAMPSGRGFVSDNSYIFPVVLPDMQGEIVKIDLADGTIAERLETPEEDVQSEMRSIVLGNLICHNDHILAQGTDKLRKFQQNKDLREKVTAWLQQNPDDHANLALHGELLLADGKLPEAIVALRKAYHNSNRRQHLDVLAGALLTALETDFAGQRELAGEAEALVNSPDALPAWRGRFLRAMALGCQRSGDLPNSLDYFLRLIADEPAPSAIEKRRDPLEQAGPNWRVRRSRWVRARIEELLSDADARQRQSMQAAVSAHFERSVADAEQGRLEPLRRLIDLFGDQPAADDARVRLAKGLIASECWLEADLLLTEMQRRGDARIVPAAVALECRLLAQAGLDGAAARGYRQLAGRYADTVCLDGRTGRQLAAEFPPESLLVQRISGTTPWQAGAVTVDASPEVASRSAGIIHQPLYPAELQLIDGVIADSFGAAVDQQRQELVLYDRLGAECARISIQREGAAGPIVNPIYNLFRGRIEGRMLVLSTGSEMFGIDLLEALRGSNDAVVWRRNLVRSNGIQRLRTASQIAPFGDSRYFPVFPVDGADKPVGQIGPTGRRGVCFQAEGELVCLDLLTGDEIWKRSESFGGCDLFGDDELLFVIPDVGFFGDAVPEDYYSGQTVLVYSMVDGRELGRRSLEQGVERWETCGRNVLVYSASGGDVELRLIDVWSGEILLKRRCTAAVRATIVDHEELAVLEPDGRFALYSLADGRPRFTAQLEPEARLAAIHVLRYDDQYLVMAGSDITHPAPNVIVQAAPSGFHAPLVHGRLYAFDPETGKMQWPTPAVIDQHGLPLDQPRSSPVLLFLRQVIRVAESRRTETTTSVLCLDRRDGRVIVANDAIHANLASPYRMIADPHEQKLTVSVPSQRFTIHFTDAPTPPAPPAQMSSPWLNDEASPDEASGTSDPRRNVLLRPEVPVPPILPPLPQP